MTGGRMSKFDSYPKLLHDPGHAGFQLTRLRLLVTSLDRLFSLSHNRLDKLNILLNQSNLQGILVVGIHKPTQHGECQGRDSSRDQPLNRTESHLRNRIGFSHMHTTPTWIIDRKSTRRKSSH